MFQQFPLWYLSHLYGLSFLPGFGQCCPASPNRGNPDTLQTLPMFEGGAAAAAAALVETAASLHGSVIDLEDLVG